MKKTRILLSCGLTGCGIVACSLLQAQTAAPNMVLILADDQGWGDLSMNGNLSVSTPHIDRIGREGAAFTNFYVCPVSSPTRAELLTGRYAARSGVRDVSEGGERMNPDEMTLADYLKQGGYATAAFGKWHNGTQYPYHPNARGFDEFYSFCSGHWGNYWNPLLERNGELVYGDGFIIDDLTTHAIEYIRQHREQPFFVYLPYNTPHSPMQVPDTWWDLVEDREIRQRATDPEKEDLAFTRAALALTENIDWNVGRVMQTLEELGLDEHTIILYLTDNGPNSDRWNGGMKGRKGSTDEGGVRSPLLVRWPEKISPGQIINQLSGAVDLLPTLTELAGLSPDYFHPLDGISLVPALSGETEETDRTLISTWNDRISVRQGKWLFSADRQLFDLSTDREQTVDVSALHPGLMLQMQKKVDWYREEVLGSLPEKDLRPFVVGHPDECFSKLPARDGTPSGEIRRSNRYPNCSYFTHWKNRTDRITWPVTVEEEGVFEAIIYYNCGATDVGALISLKAGKEELLSRLTQPNDTPMTGAELDRVPRTESYMKGFAPFSLGTIRLDRQVREITLQAVDIPGERVMDLFLLVLKRVN